MHPVPKKDLWWSVLFTCLVTSISIVCAFIDNAIVRTPRVQFQFGLLMVIGVYLALSVVAINQLRKYYGHFGHWDGAWQLSMMDLLSIAFFFGTLLLLFRALALPSDFIRFIPISAFLAAGYAAALLVVSKMGYYHTYGRWIEAFLGLLLALGVGFGGMCLHLCCCSGLFFWTLR